MEVKVGQIYRHFKGNYYVILNIAKDTETLEERVIYKAMYIKDGEFQVWDRPLAMFTERIEKIYNGPRFEFMQDCSFDCDRVVFYSYDERMTEEDFRNGITLLLSAKNASIQAMLRLFNPYFDI